MSHLDHILNTPLIDDTLKDFPKHVQDAFKKHSESLKKYCNVLMVGVGRKKVNGQFLLPPQHAIIVYVTHKENQLEEKDQIPTTLDGIPTDVVDTGGGITPA